MEALERSRLLDERYYALMGETERSKIPDLQLLVTILETSGIAYAIIGGVAVQIRHRDPRTTLDIDIAVLTRDQIPTEALSSAGFVQKGEYTHSVNFVGPHGTPIQFADDPDLAVAVQSATKVELGAFFIPVITAVALLKEKLRAASDPARRPSKRLQDLSDAVALLEQDPSLDHGLTPAHRQLLAQAFDRIK